MTRKGNVTNRNYEEEHEQYVDHVNELMANDKRIVVGVSTSQYDLDDDISSITIKLAPRDSYE